ncbi:FkbM family methyltransferase [uncultured Thiocystis sp.]|jgi:FkbM family methyltransferase|uniref:FkbM family methyltransferase n=1 Tax=uncultured Thiocystis sp. TaxID=1202134 RepID=UPI0025DB18D3|nr:FkbM family methyltransferase [uncultured Thiocystis sp.]
MSNNDFVTLFSRLSKKYQFSAPVVVFDVGANIGQSIHTFKLIWPDCNVYAFEPVSSTFNSLSENVKKYNNLELHNFALSNIQGVALMTNKPNSTMNQIVSNPKDKSNVDEIKVARGDDFCRSKSITNIGYLKVDAEGHDLLVLQGFSDMLSRQDIDFVQVEAGMSWRNQRHVSLEKYKGFLEVFGYRLLAIYEQTTEARLPLLRRSNLIFISDKLINTYTI